MDSSGNRSGQGRRRTRACGAEAVAGRREFLCSLGVGAAALLAACTGGTGASGGDSPGAVEGGRGDDATSPSSGGDGGVDGARPDAAVPRDGAVDSAIRMDADPASDGAVPADGAPPPDGPSPRDAAPPLDGAPPRDGASCSVTSADIEGPFYVAGVPVRSELDLYGEGGPRLTLSGTVLDESCRPIEHAIVQIWHADSLATYDTTSMEHRYYGQAATGADGAYRFHTILPAPYLNGAQYRPRHVHMKVWLPSAEAGALVEVLTTQIYFEGDPYIAADPWASQAPDRVIPLAEPTPDALVGVFDVSGIVRRR